MQKLNKTKYNSGDGLVLALITAAVLGGIGFAMLEYTENSNRHSKYIRAKAELDVFHNSILALLKNPASCQASFKNRLIGDKPILLGHYEYVDGIGMVYSGEKVLKKANYGSDGLPEVDDTWEINNKDSKIQLTKIVIYNPKTPVKDLPPQAPRPPTPANKGENWVTEDGWVTTVAFHYEMYKPIGNAKPAMSGPSDQVRYVTMIFDNFVFSLVTNGATDCSSSSDTWEFIYKNGQTYGTSYIKTLDQDVCFDDSFGPVACKAPFDVSVIEYGICYNATMNQPILKCKI